MTKTKDKKKKPEEDDSNKELKEGDESKIKSDGTEKEEKSKEQNDKKENETDENKSKDKSKKNENVEEVKSPDAELLPTGVIDLLAAIAQLQVRHTEVHIALGTLGVLGYGPAEWQFTIAEKCETRYTVLRMANDSESIIVKLTPFKVEFNSIDTLIEGIFGSLDQTVLSAMRIYKEPKNVSFNGQILADPDAMGIPYTDLCSSEQPMERLQNIFTPYCTLQRAVDPNFSNGHLAEGLDMLRIRELLLDLSRNDMRALRARMQTQLLYVQDGKLCEKDPIVLNPSDLLSITADPFNLNTFFDHIPRPVAYSAGMICELLSPEVSLVPFSASQILQNGGMSANKLTSLSTFANIGYNPTMQPEISAFFISLLCPGYINFSVELDDIDNSDPFLACMAGLAAKMLFNYSEQHRWNSLTAGSIEAIESSKSTSPSLSPLICTKKHFSGFTESFNTF